MRKNTRRFFFTSTLAIIILALDQVVGLAFEDTSATQTASYSFISIDIPIPGGDLGFTTLADINNASEITGGFTDSNLGPTGFLLSNKFKLTDIACPGTGNAAPQSINKHGEITGFCFTDKESGFVFHRKSKDRKHAFIDVSRGPFAGHAGINDHTQMVGDQRDGKYTLLDFPGANLTEAIGINDDGQVVGQYRDSSGTFHGFFWDAGLFLAIDVPFPEAISTVPFGINNVGQIVGFYQDRNFQPHGFLYDNGIFTSIDPPNSLSTELVDINDDGQIVGVYVADDGVPQNFLLKNGLFMTIDVPFPDAIFAVVSGINNRGQIVGRYVTSNPGDPVNPFLNHGFIATPETEPKSKSKLLVSKRNNFSNFAQWMKDGDKLGKGFAKWARRLH